MKVTFHETIKQTADGPQTRTVTVNAIEVYQDAKLKGTNLYQVLLTDGKTITVASPIVN